MNAFQIVIIAYLGLSILIGLLLVKKNKTIQAHFVAKGSLPIALAVPFAFAELTAGASTIGTTADVYSMGISGLWFKWAGVLGGILTAILVSEFYRVMQRKYGVMSVAGAFGSYFDGRVRAVVLAFTCFVYVIIFAQQPVAAASVLAPAFGIDVTAATWLIGGFFIVVTLAGGMKGLAWMNIIHTFVLLFGLGIAAVAAVNLVGGVETIALALPPSFFSVFEPDVGTALAAGLGGALSYLTAGSVVNVVFCSKSLKAGRIALWAASILTFVFAFLPGAVGLAGAVWLDGAQANQVLFLMANAVSPWVSTITSLAVLAAIISSAPAFLLVIITQLTDDLYKNHVRPKASQRELMAVSRVLTVVVGSVCVIIGLQGGSILTALLGALQIRAITAIVLVVALVWARVNSKVAFWSILLGSSVAALWNVAGSPLGVAPLWPGVLVTGVVLVAMALVQKERESEEHRRYRNAREEMRPLLAREGEPACRV